MYDLISLKRKLEDSSKWAEVAAPGIQIQYGRDEDSSLTFFL
jgi:hypothetical protein